MREGYSVSAAATVLRNGRVLAIKRRDSNEWQIPGGRVEIDESIAEACKREVLEETGSSIEVGNITGVYHHRQLHVVAFVFSATPVHGSTNLSETEESREVAWLTVEQCVERMNPVFSQRVLDSVEAQSNRLIVPPLREHDGHQWL